MMPCHIHIRCAHEIMRRPVNNHVGVVLSVPDSIKQANIVYYRVIFGIFNEPAIFLRIILRAADIRGLHPHRTAFVLHVFFHDSWRCMLLRIIIKLNSVIT
jgi:hypothetical protein